MNLRALRHFLGSGRPAQAVLLTMLTQAVVVILNVTTGVITARLLGADGRGVFAAVTLWPPFLSGLATLGLPSALVYYLRQDKADRDTAVTAGLLLALIFASVATFAGFVVVPWMMAHYSRDEIFLAWFCVVWTGPFLLILVLRQIMAAYGRIGTFNVSSYLPPLLYVVLLVPTCLLVPLTPARATFCIMLPNSLVLGWMLIDLCRVWRPSVRGITRSLHQLIAYSAQAAPGDIVTGVLANLDRLVLVALLAPEAIGLYAVAYSLSRVVLILQTVASAVLFPQMAGRTPESAKRLHDLAFRLVVYATAVGVLLAASFGRQALTFAYGPNFSFAGPILVVLVAAAGIASAAVVVGQLFLALHLPGWVSLAQGASLVMSAVGLGLLVPRSDGIGGAFGAALSLLAGSILRLGLLLPGIYLQLRLTPPRLHMTSGDIIFLRNRFLSAGG